MFFQKFYEIFYKIKYNNLNEQTDAALISSKIENIRWSKISGKSSKIQLKRDKTGTHLK